MAEIKTRPVGKTKLRVTELGFGSATLVGANGTNVSAEQALATIRAGLDAGIGYFDTAPHYGFGRGEHLMGDALRFSERPFVLSTKVGRLLKPVRSDAERTVPHTWTQPFPFEIAYDYSYDAIMRSFEDSLQRLGLSKIDILLVHDIGTKTHGVEGNRRHWADLAGGIACWLLTKRHPSLAVRTLGVFLGATLVARAAHGHERVGSIMRWTPIGGGIKRPDPE